MHIFSKSCRSSLVKKFGVHKPPYCFALVYLPLVRHLLSFVSLVGEP